MCGAFSIKAMCNGGCDVSRCLCLCNVSICAHVMRGFPKQPTRAPRGRRGTKEWIISVAQNKLCNYQNERPLIWYDKLCMNYVCASEQSESECTHYRARSPNSAHSSGSAVSRLPPSVCGDGTENPSESANAVIILQLRRAQRTEAVLLSARLTRMAGETIVNQTISWEDVIECIFRRLVRGFGVLPTNWFIWVRFGEQVRTACIKNDAAAGRKGKWER